MFHSIKPKLYIHPIVFRLDCNFVIMQNERTNAYQIRVIFDECVKHEDFLPLSECSLELTPRHQVH
jgi:hypothetical protein